MVMLRIAIQSKGRLNEESLALLQDIGIEVDVPKRKLVSKSQTFPIEALYLRDDDRSAFRSSLPAAPAAYRTSRMS